jgi:large subunit ribosomal protein L24
MTIKKGDTVKILTGKDKGKTGLVLRAYPEVSRVIVGGINIRKYVIKPKKNGEKGRIEEKEFPIHVSNVGLLDPKLKIATRVRSQKVDGTKVRVSVKTGEIIK